MTILDNKSVFTDTHTQTEISPQQHAENLARLSTMTKPFDNEVLTNAGLQVTLGRSIDPGTYNPHPTSRSCWTPSSNALFYVVKSVELPIAPLRLECNNPTPEFIVQEWKKYVAFIANGDEALVTKQIEQLRLKEEQEYDARHGLQYR